MIPLCEPHIHGNEWQYIKECLDTNWVSSAGSYVDAFEERFAAFLSVQQAVVTVNGTAALETALRVLGIGPGDEVIVPSMTFIAPVNAVKYVGASPVFVDITKDTWVMDTDKIEPLLTKNTKAIIPVHIYGQPIEMDRLMAIANTHGLYVIEDATESLGALYHGKHTGTLGHIGCFSFNGNKLMTTGAGGMLVSNNEAYATQAKYLTTQTKTMLQNGIFYHDEIGYNYRMPNLNAAMGCAQLEQIDMFIRQKRKNARLYCELLKHTKGIVLPTEKECTEHIHWLFSIILDEDYPISRDQLIHNLKQHDIQSRPFFYPVHKMKPYEATSQKLPVTDKISASGINLPSSVGLSEQDVCTVCDIIIKYSKGEDIL